MDILSCVIRITGIAGDAPKSPSGQQPFRIDAPDAAGNRPSCIHYDVGCDTVAGFSDCEKQLLRFLKSNGSWLQELNRSGCDIVADFAVGFVEGKMSLSIPISLAAITALSHAGVGLSISVYKQS